MPSIKNMKKETLDIKLQKTPYASLVSMIPQVVNKFLSFEIVDGNCPLANAIRRTLMSEVPVRHLTASLTDIHSDDYYVIKKVMQMRLEMIAISQSTNLDNVYSIKVENKTDDAMDVMSNEIKLNGVSRTQDILPGIPLSIICKNKSFAINDIHVIESYGMDNGRVSIGNIGYEILNQDFTVQSTKAKPTHFKITVETPGIIDPTEMVYKSIDSLIKRIDAIDYGNFIIEFDVYKLTILNDTHSIGTMIVWYIHNYVGEPFSYCAKRLIHPSQRECVIDIKHPDAEKLCKKAVVLIKKDLNDLLKSFT